jgi:DNA-directed RNA polymerase subunit K/omega
MGMALFSLQPISTFRSVIAPMESKTIIPLDLLVSFHGNMYAETCAMIKRSYQIHLAGDEELEANRGKVVSTAIKQILTEKVRYRLES